MNWSSLSNFCPDHSGLLWPLLRWAGCSAFRDHCSVSCSAAELSTPICAFSGLQPNAEFLCVLQNKKHPGLNLGRDLFVWSLHVAPIDVWILFRYSGFLPTSKNIHVRLIGHSKLALSVSVYGCLSYVSLCWPCDGLAICPGCTLPLTLWQLGKAPVFSWNPE